MSIKREDLSAKSELELYELIQGLGGLIHSTNLGVAKGHLTEESGQSDIRHYRELQEAGLDEAVKRFGVVRPDDGLMKPADGDWSKFPAPPDGKKWYWQWYEEMRSLETSLYYQGIICSSCPFSTGDMGELNRTGVCCSIIPSGVCFLRPTVPYLCALIGHEDVFDDSSEFTTEKLLKQIEQKFGQDPMNAFVARMQEISVDSR